MNTELLKRTFRFVAWDTKNKVKEFLSLCRRFGIDLTNKQLSEILSAIIETSFVVASEGFAEGMSDEFLYPDVWAPKADHEPDLYFEGEPLEIKTKFGKAGAWRGGAFSKRSSDYVFIAWERIRDDLSLFACHKYVTEDMWKEGNVGQYYATRLDLEDIMDGTILMGEARLAKTRYHAITEEPK